MLEHRVTRTKYEIKLHKTGVRGLSHIIQQRKIVFAHTLQNLRVRKAIASAFLRTHQKCCGYTCSLD